MVEVFKTNVAEAEDASKMVALLLQHFPGTRINFDLEDCDRVLRVQGAASPQKIIQLVTNKGYECSVLE